MPQRFSALARGNLLGGVPNDLGSTHARSKWFLKQVQSAVIVMKHAPNRAAHPLPHVAGGLARVDLAQMFVALVHTVVRLHQLGHTTSRKLGQKLTEALSQPAKPLTKKRRLGGRPLERRSLELRWQRFA
eukprot:scaffold150792_cov35-Tisochrysis_lutea.AAC.3